MQSQSGKVKFCPKCGEKTEKFYSSLCRECFLEKLSVVDKVPDRLVLRQCKNCGKIYVNEDFAETVEGALDILLRELLQDKQMKVLHSATYRIEGRRVHITLVLRMEDLEKIEKKDAELVVKAIVCQTCSMQGSGYFQSVLQLRGPKELLEVLFDDAHQQIEFLSHYDQHAFISKIERKKEGIDLYIGSKKVAMQIAKNIKNRFNASITISRKLAGKEQGQKLYRDTVLVRLGEKKK